ncbi:MAG: hypothetical protein WC196_06820 [Bacilli bacterium]|jgi:hypothetical protein
MKLRIGFVSNSSSEAFICETKKTLDEIEAELREMLELYNKLTGSNHNFDDVFQYPVLADDSNTDYLNEYRSYYKQPKQDLTGKVIIYSASDNTIPWALFELIEEAYNATRIHMG